VIGKLGTNAAALAHGCSSAGLASTLPNAKKLNRMTFNEPKVAAVLDVVWIQKRKSTKSAPDLNCK